MSQATTTSLATPGNQASGDGNAPITKARTRSTGKAVVKSVLSGDCLILMGAPSPGQLPPEKQVIIQGITAPRFAKTKSSQDDPFGWEAREFMRKKCIGKQVTFSVSGSNNTTGREYASVFLGHENLAHSICRAGLAKVNLGRDGTVHPEKRETYGFQQQAESLQLGMHLKNANPKNHVRAINWFNDDHAYALWNKTKGQFLTGVVEYVLDGSCLRIGLTDEKRNLNHTMILLHLSGVHCARTPRPYRILLEQWERAKELNPDLEKPKRPRVEPMSLEAKQFVEARLLHRDCQVYIQGVDKFNNLFGTVHVQQGNVSMKLLQHGFGKFVDWSAKACSQADYKMMQDASKMSIERRSGVNKNYQVKEEKGRTGEIQAKVMQVMSGDCVTVRDAEGTDIKVMLASVRAPRAPRRDAGQPLGFEAKEYLRKRLIGKKVRVVFDYSRKAPPTSNDQSVRQYGTLYLNNSNLSVELLERGFATINRHLIDEPRADAYFNYLEVEHVAIQAGRGLHNKKTKPQCKVIVDLTIRGPRRPRRGDDNYDEWEEQPVSKARQFSSFLVDKHLDAVVEHTFSATRLKLYVPKQNVYITFALVGTRLPQANADGTNPFSKQALAIVRSKLLQHNVKIFIETMDRGDNFIGTLKYATQEGDQDLGVELLNEGLVDLFESSADRAKTSAALFNARDGARAKEKNLWVGYAAKKAEREKARSAAGEAAAAEEAAQVRTGSVVPVVVSEIVDGVTFFVTFPEDETKDIINKKMAEFAEGKNEDDSAEAVDAAEAAADDAAEAAADADDAEADAAEEASEEAEAWRPLKGSICAGLFTDGAWYRVRIDGGNPRSGFRVLFVDYGNTDLLEANKLRPLKGKVATMPGLAKLCVLSALKAPGPKSEYYEGAMEAFYEYTVDQDLVATVNYMDYRTGNLHVTLQLAAKDSDEKAAHSINEQVLRDGWVRVAEKTLKEVSKLKDKLRPHMDYAMRQHTNIWEYGDVSDEEEEEGKVRWDGGRVPLKKFGADKDEESK